MKKFTIILVMTAMLCTSVSCGNYTADKITDEFSVTSVAEETTEEVTESEMEEIEEETTEEISKTSVEGSEEYAEVIEKLLECKSNDVDTVIKLCYPDKYFDTIKTLHN
ncbi:MAG: hypothetical protein K2K02_02500, partial [Ruminococcus sp.]|nr:hypothetical protein [Ruminococcus sp.]